MKFEDHCIKSKAMFGDEWAQLHLWLDEFAGSQMYGSRHRRVRHHLKGILEAVEKFGPNAGAAARQHIIDDLMQEGWKEGDPFPKDENDYLRMGLW